MIIAKSTSRIGAAVICAVALGCALGATPNGNGGHHDRCVSSKVSGDHGVIGMASMDANRVITFHVIGKYVGQDNRNIVIFRYKPGSPGYVDAFHRIGGIKPGEQKPIPPYQDASGSISMDSKRVITIRLWSLVSDGGAGSMIIKIKPGEPGYSAAIESVCGLEPGQTKSVPKR